MKKIPKLFVFYVFLFLSLGCKSKEEPECEPANPSAQTETNTPLDKGRVLVAPKDADWCRACVVGPKGYMSCKKVDGQPGPEHRRGLRARARLEACLDSGFTEENCPKENVMAIVCKGDSEPNQEQKTKTAQKVLKALKNSGPLVLKQPEKSSGKDAASTPSAEPEKTGEAAKTPEKGKESTP